MNILLFVEFGDLREFHSSGIQFGKSVIPWGDPGDEDPENRRSGDVNSRGESFGWGIPGNLNSGVRCQCLKTAGVPGFSKRDVGISKYSSRGENNFR